MTKDVVISVRGLQVMDNESARYSRANILNETAAFFYCMTNIMRALTSRSKMS